METSKEDIEMLFEACDPDGRGYLTLKEFERIGEGMNLSGSEVKKIFNSMDTNNDGRVEHSEFLSSFHAFTSLTAEESMSSDEGHFETLTEGHLENHEDQLDGYPDISIIVDSPSSPMPEMEANVNNNNNGEREKDKGDKLSVGNTRTGRLSDSPSRRRSSTPRVNGLRSSSWHNSRKIRKSSMDIDSFGSEREYTANQGSWDNFAQTLGEVVYALPSYDGISKTYRHIDAIGNADLLRNYENAIQGMVKEIGKLQSGMSALEQSYEKANEKSSEQLSMLEEEMESQIALKEKKVRDEERRKADEESSMLKVRYEEQIEQLQTAIEKLKQMDEKLSSTTPYERELETMRDKMKRMTQENLDLKSKLTETETNLILLQSSMAAMEVDHQERTIELARDCAEVNQAIDEKEQISREVESLYTNNRKLLDSNDSLREALESSFSKYKRVSAQSMRRQNIATAEHLNSPEYLRSGRSSRGSNLEYDALAECDPGRRTPDPQYGDGLHPDFDSGVGTIRDGEDSETDWTEDAFLRSRIRGSGRFKGRKSVQRHSSNASKSSWVSDGPRRTRSNMTHKGRRSPRNDFQTLSDEEDVDGGDVINDSDVTDEELQNISQTSTLSSSSRSKRIRRSARGTPTSLRKIITPDVTLGHNKRMYKVVLCGDVGVGKTSFIHRLCRNEFHRLTKSTLGVDFQIKTIQIEHDRSVSLQLWDTAGQERFRSISASYFRRAEGVLLLYDCTNQESFINVRDWMETITPVMPEGAPIMICGHKVDLREDKELAQRPVVSSQEGAQLAANYGVLFVETSALDGCNIQNAVTMLARHIKLDDITDDDVNSVKRLDTSSVKEYPACCMQS